MESLAPFGYNKVSFKQTHHHYCGFYSLNILANIIDNVVVVNGKQYPVSDETAIDWAYDGVDTIVCEKRLVYTEREWPLHTLIYNINNQIVGLVTRGVQLSTQEYCYAVQDGFNLYNNHLTGMNLIVREKKKLIAYADREFDNKSELKIYIEETQKKNCNILSYGAILYHVNKKNAQLILHNNGVQISNSQLRKSVFGNI
nr:unknown [Pieris rapae granulovirus]